MTKDEFIGWATEQGWRLDQWGHLQKTVSSRRYRMKLSTIAARYEMHTRPGWVRIASNYFKDLSITAEGKLAGMSRDGCGAEDEPETTNSQPSAHTAKAELSGETAKGEEKMSKKATMKKASKKQTEKASAPTTELKTKSHKNAESKPPSDSKKTQVLEMLARPNGATNQEIQKVTEWQPHTVRGFLSLAKKKGLNLEVIKRDSGERAYYAATT